MYVYTYTKFHLNIAKRFLPALQKNVQSENKT